MGIRQGSSIRYPSFLTHIGNYMYFVTKDSKDQPLDKHSTPFLLITLLVKLQVPDKKFSIRDEDIPNLKSIYAKMLKKDGDSSQSEQTAVSQIMEILKEKLKNNLKRMPGIY